MFGSVLDLERVFATLRGVGRTHVRRRFALIWLTAVAVGGAWAGPAVGLMRSDPLPVASVRYVVREGDSVWSIAERLRPGEDPRPAVDAIVAANDLDPRALVPGQVLVVPAGP